MSVNRNLGSLRRIDNFPTILGIVKDATSIYSPLRATICKESIQEKRRCWLTSVARHMIIPILATRLSVAACSLTSDLPPKYALLYDGHTGNTGRDPAHSAGRFASSRAAADMKHFLRRNHRRSLRRARTAFAPACRLEDLGDAAFCFDHRLRYPYVAGAMANGIGSAEIVEAMGRAGMLGFFGAAGLPLPVVEAAIDRIGRSLGDTAVRLQPHP